MPKKTKKEKIIAQFRRKLQGLHEAVPESVATAQSFIPKQAVPHSFMYQAKLNTAKPPETLIEPMDQAIRRDLVKTLFLATIAIGGEVILSVLLKK